MNSLFFETLIIDNNSYTDSDIKLLFNLFVPLGIKKFIFLSDFDFEYNSFSLQRDRNKHFALYLKELQKYKVHIKVLNRLIINQGCAFNNDFSRLYVDKNQRSLFARYPAFSHIIKYDLAKDINRMLYFHKCYPIFTNFENVINTSDEDINKNFFNIKKFSYTFDLNYIFSKDAEPLMKMMISKEILMIPSISHDIGFYAGIAKDAELFCNNIGRKQYLNLCYLFSKAERKL